MKNHEVPGSFYWSIIDPVWVRLNENWDCGSDEFLKQFRTLPGKVGRLYAAHWCQSEVCNRGFYQFFFNTTGLLAPEALEAFEAMGLVEWADALAKAMQFFGKHYPRERRIRLESLSEDGKRYKRIDVFNDLDGRFFEWLHARPHRWQLAADKYAMNASHGDANS